MNTEDQVPYEEAFDTCHKLEFKDDSVHIWNEQGKFVFKGEAHGYVIDRVYRYESPWEEEDIDVYVRNPSNSVA